MNELQEKLFLQIEMCLLLKVHIKGMYIHTYIYFGKMIYVTNTNLPTTYGMCSTVTDVFRRVGFFSKIARNSLFLCVLSDKNT